MSSTRVVVGALSKQALVENGKPIPEKKKSSEYVSYTSVSTSTLPDNSVPYIASSSTEGDFSFEDIFDFNSVAQNSSSPIDQFKKK